MDAGAINWATVLVSWAISTSTTILLIFLSCIVSKKCCCRREGNDSPPDSKNQGKSSECLDLIEWYSDKPIQTSSPIPQRRETKNPNVQLDANNNADSLAKRNEVKVGVKSTQPTFLGNIPRNLISSGTTTQDKQRQLNQLINANQKPLIPKNGPNSAIAVPNTDRQITSDRDLFRNKQSFPTNRPISRHNTEESKLNSMIKLKTKCNSAVLSAENRLELTGTRFIMDLKESPTEKKRQSVEKLRKSKTTVNKSGDENETSDGKVEGIFRFPANSNPEQKTDKITNRINMNVQIPESHQTKTTAALPQTQAEPSPNLIAKQEKPLPFTDSTNSKLPPLPTRSNNSFRNNVSRENSKNNSAISQRRHTAHSSTPILMQLAACSGVVMNQSNDGGHTKAAKSPNKISLIDIKSLSCEAFPLNLQHKRNCGNAN